MIWVNMAGSQVTPVIEPLSCQCCGVHFLFILLWALMCSLMHMWYLPKTKEIQLLKKKYQMIQQQLFLTCTLFASPAKPIKADLKPQTFTYPKVWYVEQKHEKNK